VLAIFLISNHYHLKINLDISYYLHEGEKMTKNTSRYPQRVRNELRFRELTVLRVERISAGFQRIVLGGDALDGFSSHGFDDHTKVFFPEPGSHLCRLLSPMKALSGLTAYVRSPVTTRRCMTKRAMSWHWILYS
jgi:NADPH-dependent ferric siderophore reductase